MGKTETHFLKDGLRVLAGTELKVTSVKHGHELVWPVLGLYRTQGPREAAQPQMEGFHQTGWPLSQRRLSLLDVTRSARGDWSAQHQGSTVSGHLLSPS